MALRSRRTLLHALALVPLALALTPLTPAPFARAAGRDPRVVAVPSRLQVRLAAWVLERGAAQVVYNINHSQPSRFGMGSRRRQLAYRGLAAAVTRLCSLGMFPMTEAVRGSQAT